jgi:hypothetical protein
MVAGDRRFADAQQVLPAELNGSMSIARAIISMPFDSQRISRLRYAVPKILFV